MAKRWQRGGKGRSGDTADSDDARRRSISTPDCPDDTDDVAGTDDHLATVTTPFRTPPTAEELRAAFARKKAPEEKPAGPPRDFHARFPTESLFTASAFEAPVEEEPHGDDRSRTKGDYYYDPDDAWGVLGLQPGASWPEITAAHRRLAKIHHPDRLLDATPEQQATSEERMRDVNVAYSVLRRLTGH